MKLSQLTCEEFARELSEKKPVPGGGGAAALTGALGVALNTMVINYTAGKKKFIDYTDIYNELIIKGELLREKLIDLIDKDAENFEPLSKAYAMPDNTKEEMTAKEEVLEKCLKNACSAPLEMLGLIYESLLLHKEISDKSSKIMISDIGVGVQCLKAALNSAYLNVLININSIKDETFVSESKSKAEILLEDGLITADEIYEKVIKKLNEKQV